MNPLAVKRTDPKLLYAASQRWFGSWLDAVRAAGIDPDQCRGRAPNFTKESIVAAIRKTHAEGGRINHAAFRKKAVSLAAARVFGSWDAALMAAGFDPATIRCTRRPWTKAELLETLRQLHASGATLHSRLTKPSTLNRAARLFYGSWRDALRAAGLPAPGSNTPRSIHTP